VTACANQAMKAYDFSTRWQSIAFISKLKINQSKKK
jgi:hypothetical protein